MPTHTAERQELHQVIDMLPDVSIMAVLDVARRLRSQAETVIADEDGFYDEANIRRLERSLEHAKQGKVIVKTIEELERMADE